MVQFISAIILVLLLTLVGGLWRVMRGPTRVDRMLAAQLLGTTGVAILGLLAYLDTTMAWRDVALVVALLAAISGVAFVRVLSARRVCGETKDRSC